jgi:hypothetical protein
MKACRPPLPSRFVLLVAAAAFAVILPVEGGRAQVPDEPVKGPAEKREFQVFRLKNASAREVATILRELYREPGGKGPGAGTLRELRIAWDEATNSLLVLAAPGEQAELEKLIKVLDVQTGPREEANARRVEVLFLGNLEPDEGLENALKLAVDGRPARLALDRQRRAVVLSSDRQTREEVIRVLKKLDDAQDVRGMVIDMQVRVVWLVSGLKREDAPGVPADLKEVSAELAKLGIDKPQLAAQVLVNTPLSDRFQVEGSTKLDTPCRLAVHGALTLKRDSLGLEIEINANREGEGGTGGVGGRGGPPRGQPICSLRTQITTMPGHAVVVGVTPTEGLTSVFVVQVLRKEKKEVTPKKP